MIFRLVVPIFYSILLGGVWAGIFKKKFSSSLAPAFMLHIIVVLLTGMLFGRLSIGVYGGIGLALIGAVALVFKNRKDISKARCIGFVKRLWNEGVFVFVIFYVLCFFLNYGKRFQLWDEFSHWGWFIKESFRLDNLYCTSPMSFDHKDYVPAITLFETIMCRLNGRYAEADVFRAIQIFMFSLLMPMFEAFNTYSCEKNNECVGRIFGLKNRLFQLSAVLVVLLIPLIFNTSNGFCFYHSIYCDMAVGIVFFWCAYESYRDYESVLYKLLVVSIGLTVLVLSKMMAMALLPLVVLLLFANMLLRLKRTFRFVHCLGLLPTMVIPVGMWWWFNRFVDRYVANTGYGQSYDGMRLSSLKQVFTNPANSSITFLGKLREVYIDALIHRDILIHGSYIVTMVFLVLAFFVFACVSDNKEKKAKIITVGLWSFFSGVFYGLLMFFLYATAFIEFEAVSLASYERYMNSFVISVVLLLFAVYFDSEIWKNHIKGYCIFTVLLVIDLSFFHVKAFDQVLPGFLTHDEEKVSEYLSYASVITSDTQEDESVYIVKRGDTGDFLSHLYYYCSPRVMYGGSIGSPVDDDDIWSNSIPVEELVGDIGKCDYVYFCGLDDIFIQEYSEAFEDPTLLVDGALYRVRIDESKVHLTGIRDYER